jgi:hypothetical protein
MHSRWQRTRKQRSPAAIARLVEEAGLTHSPPLRDNAGIARAGTPLARLATLPTDDFVEHARHLQVVVPSGLAAPVLDMFASAVTRLGHPTRSLSLRELCERLDAARVADRLDAELRDLDRISLIAIHGASPGDLDPGRLDLLGRFLRHRQDRGSVALGGAGAATWRSAVEVDTANSAAISAFLEACEVIDLSDLAAQMVPSQDGFLRFGVKDHLEVRGESEAAGDTEAGAVRV